MARLLSHRSVVEICTFVPRSKYASLPNMEWRFAAKHCVVREWGDPGDVLPAEYLSSDGFRISVGKYTLSEAVDAVFSPGDTPLLLTAAPEGFIEGILERYGRESKESFTMRDVQLKLKNWDEQFTSHLIYFTGFWINAYYSSFPCRRCSVRDDAKDYYEVFHLTRPEAHGCLSLKYTYYNYKQIEIVNSVPHCHCIRMTIRQLQQKRLVLHSADLRREAFEFLRRVDLDTCLLVNKLWRAEVTILSPKLALRQLCFPRFTYNPAKQSLCFIVINAGVGHSALREFTLPRNATVDSAIAVNHLRNCTTSASGLEFDVFLDDYDDRNLKLDYSVRLWICDLLSSMKDSNFRFNGLYLRLGRVNPAHAVDFLFSSSSALRSCSKHNGLRDFSLALNYEALKDLVKERFLHLPYMQNLEDIKLSISVFGPRPPDDHSWIRGLFLLPNCKKILVKYTPRGLYDPECSKAIIGVLRETVKQFENATDVSGFPDNFEFVLVQLVLTWGHQEPTPTYSNVSVPLLDGLWNVYVTKNTATDVPLSVFVDTEGNCQTDDDELPVERRFIFRKEPYANELVETSRPRKRHLQ